MVTPMWNETGMITGVVEGDRGKPLQWSKGTGSGHCSGGMGQGMVTAVVEGDRG